MTDWKSKQQRRGIKLRGKTGAKRRKPLIESDKQWLIGKYHAVNSPNFPNPYDINHKENDMPWYYPI